MIRVLVPCFFVLLCASACPAEHFSDVPESHWAAEAVNGLADAGILRGYPDGTFGGDKFVTRYELAVALERFVEFLQNSEKPLVMRQQELRLSPPGGWGAKAAGSLFASGFIDKDSSLLASDGAAPVTHAELAQSLSSVMARLIELRVPPTPD